METIVVKATCTTMVELVSDGLADFSAVLESFLNQVPTAKNLCGIVRGTADLLVWQAVQMTSVSTGGYSNPYTLRSPPHPFITILTNRPDSWLLLGNQVTYICSLEDERIQGLAIEILEPFLKFVFAEPQDNPKYQPMRMFLQRELLFVADQSDDCSKMKKILGFIANILSCLQVQDKNSVGRAALFVMDTVDVCLHRVSETEAILKKLVTYLVDLCWEFHFQSLDVSMITRYLHRVADKAPNTLSCDTNLMSLSGLLLKVDMEDAVTILKPVKKVVESDTEDLCSVAVASLVLPILQILSHSGYGPGTGMVKSAISISKGILKLIEGKLVKTLCKRKQETPQFYQHLTSATFINNNYSMLARAMEEEEDLPGLWLKNLVDSVLRLKSVPLQLTVTVAALFVLSSGKPWADQSLKALQTISHMDHKQAYYFLPLYMYKLNKNINPEYQLSIMRAIPSIAQHKICIPTVLRTIQTFGYVSRLQALSICLLSELWSLQDRCFPYLLESITKSTEVVLTKEGVDEVKLAKAKAIRDVCLLRGEQHGSDVLSPLSDLLESSTQEVDSPVASLALEGLYYLCKAEVVDILSVWSVLGEKLSEDPRSIVQGRICQLFSLLPELQVKTEEFEECQQYAVSALWLFVHGSNPSVSVAAFRALSKFDISSFNLSHMPDKVKVDFVRHAEAIIARGDNPDLTVQDIIRDVPGVCYIRLLDAISPESYIGYEDFLCEHVGSEVKKFRRGIYHTSARQLGAASNQSKAVASIPSFLQQQYDRCKHPGLLPGLAAGLLFSFDPPVEVGRDGRPRKHYSITHSKNFQHMFTTLLHEVLIQPSDWQAMLHIPLAWGAFIDRLYTAVTEGRKAEIDLQLKKDHIGEEEAVEKKKVAWLWVRDKLTEAIKNASKESPSVQGNAVLALGGLVLTSQKHWISLDKKSQSEIEQVKEFQSQTHWTTVAMDTLMSLMDVTFQPKGNILGICQQRSVDDRMTSSFLVQAASVLALCQLTPVIINLDMSRIFVMLETLTTWLPGQPDAPEAPVLQLAYGLGLGGVLGKLFEENFMDSCSSKEVTQIWQTLDKLEDVCLAGGEEGCGSLLGLGVAVTALCNNTRTEARAHVLTVLDKLQAKLQTTKPDNLVHQVLCVSLALINSSAFNANIIASDRVLSAVGKVSADQNEAPQSVELAMAVGILMYHLTKAGVSGMVDQQQHLLHTWTKNITCKESSPLLRMAAMSGLMALIGSQKTLISNTGSMSMSLGGMDADDVVKVMTQMISTGDDLGIQKTAAWMLGNYYLSASSVAETRVNVPISLKYLPESSLLRAVVDFLIEAGKKGPEAIPETRVKCCLRSLVEKVSQTLPPVNWAGILAPLMRVNFSDEVKRLCLQLAITQSFYSPTAAILVSSWMVSPLLQTLNDSCRGLLYVELPTLVTSVSPATLTSLLDMMQKEKGDLYLHGLYGLHRALKIRDLPSAVTDILLQCLKSVYKRTVGEQTDYRVHHLLGECLGSVPDAVFDDLTEGDFSDADDHFLCCFVRCYLVVQGRQPMALLNRCVDASLNNPDSITSELHALFYHTFWHIAQSQAESNGTLHRLQWLLELLGHIRNVSTGAITLSDKVTNTDQMVQFGIHLAASVISMFTSSSTALVYNINPQFLMDSYPNSPFQEGHNLTLSRCPGSPVNFLPSFITGLEGEPWSQILLKVLDWMGLMQKKQTPAALSAVEISLKHSVHFRRVQTWTDVIQRYNTISEM
ncbi:focadhesin-like isoform X2 [Ostrea edulis]|nr:focadhesin-like isoform X2 [Ostrea edulis]